MASRASSEARAPNRIATKRRRCFHRIRQLLSAAPPRAVIGDLAWNFHAEAPQRRCLQEEQERRRDGVRSLGTEGLRGGEKRRIGPAAADQLLLALKLQRVRCGAELLQRESAEVRGDKRGRVRGAEKELLERTGSATVPKIFFGDKLIGGLVELNALRKDSNKELERRLKEAEGEGLAAPAYGFDEAAEEVEEEEAVEEVLKVVRVLRQRLPIQDRVLKMKIARNCFAGSELVELLVRHHGYALTKAVEIGKQLCKKHFIHHVFGENDFEEGNHFYRFVEHEPFISKCFNFRGATNDSEPKAAAAVCDRLTKIMFAILESYASEDRQRVDYVAIGKSEEFRRYVNMTQDLQRVNLLELSENETLAFFLNLYNAMIIHAIIRVGCEEGVINRRSFSDFQYLIGGHSYSLSTIKNGILRSNRRSPYSLIKPFGSGDRRLELALVKLNPLVHFGLCNGTKSSPKVRFFSPYRVAEELRCAAREFFENDGIEVELEKRTIHITPIFKWYSGDFGQEINMLKWIINYLDANKAGLLTHLLGDGAHVNVSYMSYDWSINS
ncbi:hypothetical protein ACSQ67_026384 [Phaseolus vulgaris]